MQVTRRSSLLHFLPIIFVALYLTRCEQDRNLVPPSDSETDEKGDPADSLVQIDSLLQIEITIVDLEDDPLLIEVVTTKRDSLITYLLENGGVARSINPLFNSPYDCSYRKAWNYDITTVDFMPFEINEDSSTLSVSEVAPWRGNWYFVTLFAGFKDELYSFVESVSQDSIYISSTFQSYNLGIDSLNSTTFYDLLLDSVVSDAPYQEISIFPGKL